MSIRGPAAIGVSPGLSILCERIYARPMTPVMASVTQPSHVAQACFFPDNESDSRGPKAMKSILRVAATVIAFCAPHVAHAAPATAPATCRNTANFNTWLEQFKREAIAQGISQQAIATAAPYMVLD